MLDRFLWSLFSPPITDNYKGNSISQKHSLTMKQISKQIPTIVALPAKAISLPPTTTVTKEMRTTYLQSHLYFILFQGQNRVLQVVEGTNSLVTGLHTTEGIIN